MIIVDTSYAAALKDHLEDPETEHVTFSYPGPLDELLEGFPMSWLPRKDLLNVFSVQVDSVFIRIRGTRDPPV